MTENRIIPSDSDHVRGDIRAPIFLIEYGDYQCPHSRKSHYWVKSLLKEFNPFLCYIFRHFPLSEIHPNAEMASLAVESAGLHHLFWEMHDAIFERMKEFSFKDIVEEARKMGIQQKSFISDMNKKELMETILNHILSGRDQGIQSTPVFFINGKKLEGPLSYEILRENILKEKMDQIDRGTMGDEFLSGISERHH